MNSRWPFVLVFAILIIPITSFAQTSDLILLDERNHYGQLSIENVHVSQSDYYKVIFMYVHVKVKDLALEDSANVFWDSITLTNENGKEYQAVKNVGPDCNKKTWDGTFYEVQLVSGTEGGIGQHSLCYMVEKEFNNFKVYYTIPTYDIHNPNNPYRSFQIGNIDLNQKNEPTSDVVSDIKNLNMTKSTDFFSQILEWFKNLFKFS